MDSTWRNISRHPHCLILTRVNKVRFSTLTPAEATDTLLLIDSTANLASVTGTLTSHTQNSRIRKYIRTLAHQRLAGGLARFDWLRLAALVQRCASCASPSLRMPPSGEPRGHHNLPLITLAPQSVTALQGPAKSF